MKGQQKLWVLLLCCILWFLGSAPAWATVDARLEQSILEVLDTHPEAILKSLSAYQRRQREQKAHAQAQLFEQVRQQLPQILQHTPIRSDRQHASVTLIEFADFACPFCRQAHPGLKQLYARYPNAAFAYKHLPLDDIHPQAIPAAKAAWAAQQQGKFWQYHDALYETKQPLAEAVYLKIAKTLALDLAQFNHDRQSDAASQAISQDMQLAQQLQITGTPFFLVAGSETLEMISGADFERLDSFLSRS